MRKDAKMYFIVYLVAFFISVAFLYQVKFGHRNRLLSKFLAEKSYPILNHGAHLIGKAPEEIFEVFQKFGAKHGPVFRLDLTSFKSLVVVYDPKVVEAILSSQKLIDKSSEYLLLEPFIGTGLLVSSGNKWFQRRKIITPAFHFKILEQFVEIMNKHSDIFVQKLKAMEGQHVDVFPMISLYALDVICESAMGNQVNAQIDENSEYVRAVKEICKILFMKVFHITKRIHFIYRFTALYQREKELIKKLHSFTDSVIAARREYLRNLDDDQRTLESIDEFGIKKKTAFLDLLLQVKVDGEPLSDESIREEVDTFMFEGHDTTTSAIAFTMLNLAKYEDIQEKVYEEVKDDVQAKSMADLNKFTYLEKVIKESLRLYPSVPFFSRVFSSDVEIGNYTFPANVSVRISPFLMGRDPNVFPNPLKFDPSRFDDEETVKLFSFVPFSAGPRNCIGQRFAMLEIKSVISKVVKNFKLSVKKENEDCILASELVLRSMNGVVLCMTSR